jgi:hypothetical protein
MGSSSQYRESAAECMRAAQAAKSPGNKALDGRGMGSTRRPRRVDTRQTQCQDYAKSTTGGRRQGNPLI